MKHEVCWHANAWEDYLYFQQHDKKLVKKTHQLLKDIDRQPFSGQGKPEALKHHLQGFWSRRINREHRLVYCVAQQRIIIAACRYHYE